MGQKAPTGNIFSSQMASAGVPGASMNSGSVRSLGINQRAQVQTV